ncbi:hypothetical protein AB0B31_33205 [Catellatospora citrea]|uniref:phosphorylase family protein n=1 Tax=Catellatospora citrea TaxID=53366 RepID=UPI0034094A5A
MSSTANDVRYGIVTALPIEYAAARSLLDDPRQPTLPHAHDSYLVGDLPSRAEGRPHAVALTMLAHDGTRSAAAACTNLLATFPSIRCVLMLGIAGGIPRADDPRRRLRLGDIVVATEGLVDYGHVRAVDGANVLRRNIDNPSAALLAADRVLHAGEPDGQRPWEAWLGSGPALPARFARPPEGTDPLAGLPQQPADDAQRRDRFPRVHRGRVGSADVLLRDAVMRDRLAETHGICAVEMEGAGIAAAAALRSVSWFMVRGIVDYCDGTKDDAWHPYAALAAAAYTRALLAQCDPPAETAVAAAPEAALDHRHVLHGTALRGALPALQVIVEALLDIEEVRDHAARKMMISMLPRDIQTAVPDHSVARLHVIALVRTCGRFSQGQSALLQALRTTLPDGSLDRERAEMAILMHWPGPTG